MFDFYFLQIFNSFRIEKHLSVRLFQDLYYSQANFLSFPMKKYFSIYWLTSVFLRPSINFLRVPCLLGDYFFHFLKIGIGLTKDKHLAKNKIAYTCVIWGLEGQMLVNDLARRGHTHSSWPSRTLTTDRTDLWI